MRKKVDLFGIFFNNREKKSKNAAFTEKLSPDRNGAERSKGGKVFRPLNGAQAEPCRSRFVAVVRSLKFFKIKKTMILTDFQNHRFFSFYIFLGFFVSVKLFKHVLVFFCN